MVSCPLDQLNIQQGDDLLTLYQWNTHTARHYFCKTCGVYTFHQRRTDPSVYGVNIGCFDDVDGTAFHDAPTADGVSLSLVSQGQVSLSQSLVFTCCYYVDNLSINYQREEILVRVTRWNERRCGNE